MYKDPNINNRTILCLAFVFRVKVQRLDRQGLQTKIKEHNSCWYLSVNRHLNQGYHSLGHERRHNGLWKTPRHHKTAPGDKLNTEKLSKNFNQVYRRERLPLK